MKREREADRSNLELPHRSDGGDPRAVEIRVFGELRSAGDGGDRDRSRLDLRVNGDGDGIAEGVDGASEEIEAGAEVGDGGGSEGG